MLKIKLNTKNIYFVMYHYVREKKKKNSVLNFLEISEFKRQISFFKKNANILNNEDLNEILITKKTQKKPVVILTFDDGYYDHYKYVFPILKKNKISGFFYPPINVIENSKILDVNKIHFILAKENHSKILKLIFSYLKNDFEISQKDLIKLKNLKIKNRYDNRETGLIKILLQNYLPFNQRTKILSKIFKKLFGNNESYLSNKTYLSKKNILEMSDNSMSFGSHGYNHHWWETLSISDQEYELKKSINFYKKNNLYKKPFSVAYPYGSYNQNSIKLLKKYKVSFALTTKPGSVNLRNIKNNFIFPRYDTNDFK